MTDESTFHAVIMAGGSGTRFWPASRRAKPKQLLELWGEPMIARTVTSIAPLVAAQRQWIITAAHLADDIRAAVPAVPAEHVVAEPVGRNTAPCVGLAAMMLRALHGEDVVFGLFPADHHVAPLSAWETSLRAAYREAASSDAIVTLGIPPTRPETGYGYIECAAVPPRLGEDDTPAAVDVRRFVEKPDRAKAQTYLSGGNFLWNAGIFVTRAAVIMAEIERLMPDLHRGLLELESAFGTDRWADALARIYPTLPATSIDFGVMERAAKVRCVPATFGWSDVGHWGALDETLPSDGHGNVTVGDVICLGAERSIAVSASSDKTLVLLDVEDLVVVDTGDALLVRPRDRVQQVRRVVDALKESGRDELL